MDKSEYIHTIENWASSRKVELFRSNDGKDVRFFYLSIEAECLQVVLEPNDDEIRADIWPVETADDTEFHNVVFVPFSRLDDALDAICGRVYLWLSRRAPLP